MTTTIHYHPLAYVTSFTNRLWAHHLKVFPFTRQPDMKFLRWSGFRSNNPSQPVVFIQYIIFHITSRTGHVWWRVFAFYTLLLNICLNYIIHHIFPYRTKYIRFLGRMNVIEMQTKMFFRGESEGISKIWRNKKSFIFIWATKIFPLEWTSEKEWSISRVTENLNENLRNVWYSTEYS